MTGNAPLSSAIPSARPSVSSARAVGTALGTASVVILGLCLGCDNAFTNWCLVEGDVDGARVQGQAEPSENGTIVRLAPSGPGAHGAVVTIPGATLDTLPVGEQAASANVEVTVCEGDAVTACVPVRGLVLEVEDLDDGTARVSFSGTTLDANGQEVPAEGSFVFIRGSDSSLAAGAPASMTVRIQNWMGQLWTSMFG